MASSENDKKSDEKEAEEKIESTESTESTDESGSEDKSKESEENQTDKKEETPVDESDESKELKELTEDDVFTILKTFPGVGQVMAQRIFKAGFDTREKLLAITIEDLKKIRGIGALLAGTIADGMEKAVKDFDEPEKTEKETTKEGPGITDKAVGFIKGTFSKITGFFKGKTPKGKAEDSKPGDKVGDTGDIDKDKELKPETASGDSNYPEVGAPDESKEPEKEPEPVTIEPSESEPEDKILAPEPEKEHEPKPKHEEIKEEPKISLYDASGLFTWFEKTPNLSVETGKLVFKAGYNNLEELKEAVIDDLVLINGIDKKEAELICDEIRKIS
jgi:DNA uptake protein ComE-like DNA-binding protein